MLSTYICISNTCDMTFAGGACVTTHERRSGLWIRNARMPLQQIATVCARARAHTHTHTHTHIVISWGINTLQLSSIKNKQQNFHTAAALINIRPLNFCIEACMEYGIPSSEACMEYWRFCACTEQGILSDHTILSDSGILSACME